MRWLVCCVLLLTGCLRARGTVVHPTGLERSNSSGPDQPIARTAPQAREVSQAEEASTSIVSLELGVPVRLNALDGTSRVHLAPGARVFASQLDTVLWGLAVGIDYDRNPGGTGFALEGSVHIGDGGTDPQVINQALDLFAGVTMHSRRTSAAIAVGPSVGILGMPGGGSVVMVGLGVRLSSGRSH